MGEITGEIGKERESGHLLKTGQTTQYGGYEDDGYFEKGLSKQYDILTTGRYAGTTAITLNAKTDTHSNNCVYDQRTKLMWSRYVAGSVGPGSNGSLPWTTNVNGEGIFAYADAANAAKLAGHDDWRIPNSQELLSLLKNEQPSSYPDTIAFPIWTGNNYIWTSTTAPVDITSAFEVNFFTAIQYYDNKINNNFVALVRGG